MLQLALYLYLRAVNHSRSSLTLTASGLRLVSLAVLVLGPPRHLSGYLVYYWEMSSLRDLYRGPGFRVRHKERVEVDRCYY